MIKWVWRLHQFGGVIAGIALILWALSGVLHPIMARLQPKPMTVWPPIQQIKLANARPLLAVLAQHSLSKVHQVGVAVLDGHVYYQVWVQAGYPARYFAVEDGSERLQADQSYALYLARHFTGKQQVTATLTWVNTFSSDYPALQRVLPVWRVDFDDGSGLRAYVDTQQGRLSALSNPLRESLMCVFRVVHVWSFLHEWPPVARAGMLLLLLLLGVMLLSGMYLWLRWRQTAMRRLQHRTLSRWHRHLAMWASVPLLLLLVSAVYRVWHVPVSVAVSVPPWADFPRAAIPTAAWGYLTQQPLARLSLAWLDGAVVWQVMPATSVPHISERAQVASLAVGENEQRHHAVGTQSASVQVRSFRERMQFVGSSVLPEETEARLARQLASHFAQLPLEQITTVRLVSQFDEEYGFLNKRLPVYRVEFAAVQHPRYYVDTRVGVLAARVDDQDAREAWSFSQLHKWNFIRSNKDWRDGLLVLGALLSMGLAVLGLWQRWQRRQKRLQGQRRSRVA